MSSDPWPEAQLVIDTADRSLEAAEAEVLALMPVEPSPGIS